MPSIQVLCEITAFPFGCTEFMRSNRICAREEPAAGPSSFKNIVRISMDLSVISVVLVSSRRTRGLVSINLIRKGVLQLLVVIFILWRTHRDTWSSRPTGGREGLSTD